MKRVAPAVWLLAGTIVAGQASAASFFIPGNLVVSVEGNGVQGAISGPYTDKVAFAPTAGVPEPSAYALMILGFGGIGGLLRSRRRRRANAA